MIRVNFIEYNYKYNIEKYPPLKEIWMIISKVNVSPHPLSFPIKQFVLRRHPECIQISWPSFRPQIVLRYLHYSCGTRVNADWLISKNFFKFPRYLKF